MAKKLSRLICFFELVPTYPQLSNTGIFEHKLMEMVNGSTSKDYFECVMINKSVDIEGGEDVQSIHVIDLPVYRCLRREPREQVRSANDGVDVYDTHMTCPPADGLRLHNPQAGTGIRLIARGVPVHKRTLVISTIVREPEK